MVVSALPLKSWTGLEEKGFPVLYGEISYDSEAWTRKLSILEESMTRRFQIIHLIELTSSEFNLPEFLLPRIL